MGSYLLASNKTNPFSEPNNSTTFNSKFLPVLKPREGKKQSRRTLHVYQYKKKTQVMDVVNQLVAQQPLVIFAKSSCCISHSVMQLISSYGANATVYQLDEMSNGKDIDKALQKLGLRPGVPAVFIGQKLVGGAKEIISLQVQGRLVPLLKEAGALWL